MNVLGLDGGLCAKERTATILRAIDEGAKKAGVDVTWADIYTLEIALGRALGRPVIRYY